MWSHYWDDIKDGITKCFSDAVMSYQWEIEFCYRGSKIRDLIWSLQQNHSSLCDTINMCTLNLFVLSNLVPRVSWLSDKEEGAYKKASMSWEQGCVFSYSTKIELRSLTQGSHVTKKIKDEWAKKAKKKKLRKS